MCVHREVVKDKMEDCIEVEAARSKRKSSNTEREMVTIKKVCLSYNSSFTYHVSPMYYMLLLYSVPL